MCEEKLEQQSQKLEVQNIEYSPRKKIASGFYEFNYKWLSGNFR